MSAQRVWEDNKNILSVVGLALLAAIAAQLVIVGPIGHTAEKDAQTYQTLATRLEKARKGPFDLADTTSALKSSSAEFTEELEALKKRVMIPFEEWVNVPKEYASDPGAWFALKHAEVRDGLYERCQKVRPRVTLGDETLGFGVELSSRLDHADAQTNLKRLSIVNKLVELLADAGVKEISKITPSAPEMTGAEGHGEFVREYPVELVVRTRLDPLMRFLHDIRKPGEFFLVIRELQVTGMGVPKTAALPGEADGRELDVIVSASGMRFPAEEELLRSPKPRARSTNKVRRKTPLGI